MYLLDTEIQSYLQQKGATACSCTLPYDNLRYIKNLSLFSYTVMVLSPSNPYPQFCSILSHYIFTPKNSTSIKPSDILLEAVQFPRETELFILLPGFENDDENHIERCISVLISRRIRRDDCVLFANSSTTENLLQEITDKGNCLIENCIEERRTDNFTITKIQSSYQVKEVSSDTFYDEEGDEIEEED